jgi:hypothetical protein
MVKPRRILKLDLQKELNTPQTFSDIDEDRILFGKYCGNTPLWIAENDPDYLIWAYETFTQKPCSKDLYELCKLDSMEEDESIREALDGFLKFRK